MTETPVKSTSPTTESSPDHKNNLENVEMIWSTKTEVISEEDHIDSWSLNEHHETQNDCILWSTSLDELKDKYNNYMLNIANSLPENDITQINFVYRFTWNDAFRAIRAFYDHFKYCDISFSDLPIMYTIIRDNDENLYNLRNHTIVICGLQHDNELCKNIESFIKTELKSLWVDSSIPLFKLSVLPQIILENDERQLDIPDDKDYNSIYLTTSTRYNLNKDTEQPYDIIWLYTGNLIYSWYGKYESKLDEFGNKLDTDELMLIKLPEIGNLFKELQWDRLLPDQMNILAYGFGHEIFDESYTEVWKNMSIFYHKQTDECYLIHEKCYHDQHESVKTDILNQVMDFLETKTLPFCKTPLPPRLKLTFKSFEDLFKSIEELTRSYSAEILYMSNLLDYSCEIIIYFSYDTIKAKKFEPLNYIQDYDFENLIEFDNSIKWLEIYDEFHKKFKELALLTESEENLQKQCCEIMNQ